jgi:hypothetical protein
MNHDTAGDNGFPAFFVVLSTFLGVIIWMCVMLTTMNQ